MNLIDSTHVCDPRRRTDSHLRDREAVARPLTRAHLAACLEIRSEGVTGIETLICLVCAVRFLGIHRMTSHTRDAQPSIASDPERDERRGYRRCRGDPVATCVLRTIHGPIRGANKLIDIRGDRVAGSDRNADARPES
jgi:hypothetical protein